MKREVLSLDRVTVEEDGATLLDGVSLRIFMGEALGLIPVNGWGLDRLVGLTRRNTPLRYGRVYYDEALVNSYRWRNPVTVNKTALIDGQSALIDGLTVAENIYVLRGDFGGFLVKPKTLRERVCELTKALGPEFDVNPDAYAGELTAYEKCVVELLMAVVAGNRLITLWEIGSRAGDTERLHSLIKRLTDRGFSFLYISGRHGQVFDVCHRAALMENGRIRRFLSREEFDELGVYGQVKPGTADGPDAAPVVLELKNAPASGGDLILRKGSRGLIHVPDNNKVEELLAYIAKTCPDMAVIAENPIQTMLFPSMSYIENLCFGLDRRPPYPKLNKRLYQSVALEYEPLLGPDIYKADITGLSDDSLYNLVYYRTALSKPGLTVCVNPMATADVRQRQRLDALTAVLQAAGAAVLVVTTNPFE